MTKQTKQVELSELQKRMLSIMLNWRDYVYGYDVGFEELILDEEIPKEALKKEMKGLLKSGLVKYGHGLNDDGEVMGGAWFSIVWEKIDEVKKLIGGQND